MSKRTTGTIFILIAALLLAAQTIAAAIYANVVTSPNLIGSVAFNQWFDYTADPVTVYRNIACLIGFVYLVLAERQEWRARSRPQNDA